jgi:hypothetical protein
LKEHIEIWNLLHDGLLSLFIEEDSSSITAFVHIPYIRRRISPIGVCFVLKLSGVKSCTFKDFDGNEESISKIFNSNSPDILNVESEEMPITISTTFGTLILEYESVNVYLESGLEIDYETISNACSEYWEEWGSKNKA